jgi:hypothetical protein
MRWVPVAMDEQQVFIRVRGKWPGVDDAAHACVPAGRDVARRTATWRGGGAWAWRGEATSTARGSSV